MPAPPTLAQFFKCSSGVRAGLSSQTTEKPPTPWPRPRDLGRAPFSFRRCYIPNIFLLMKYGKNSTLREEKRLKEDLIFPRGEKRLTERFTFLKCIYFISHMLTSQTSPQRHFADETFWEHTGGSLFMSGYYKTSPKGCVSDAISR